MTGIRQSDIGDESARWFVREKTGTVHLLSIRRDGRVRTLPHQPALDECPDLSAPLRARIISHVRGAVQAISAPPAS